MTQKSIFFLFFVALASIAAGLIFVPRSLIKETTVSFSNGTTVQVEIVDTDWERQKGLAEHKPLEDEEGMLFVFDQKAIQNFWMKGMEFPIDIIWIDEGKIVGFEQNVPIVTKQAQDHDFPMYRSPMPVEYVLEVRAGWVKEKGIEFGSEVMISQKDY